MVYQSISRTLMIISETTAICMLLKDTSIFDTMNSRHLLNNLVNDQLLRIEKDPSRGPLI